MDRLLLAVDGSEHANRAAELAGELSRYMKLWVDIIHVVPGRAAVVGPAVHEYARIEELYITQSEILKATGRDIIEDAARIVRAAGGRVGSHEVVVGPPAQEIAEYAERTEVDAIVMGRRGLGEIKGLLMGSVSHRVGQLTDKTLITAE